MSGFLRSLTLARMVAILTFLAVFVMAVRTPVDTDTLWHLRAGEWQVDNRALLRTDLFSHTRYGQAWINHSWLSQIVLYVSYAALGDWGLALYTAILATLGMLFVYLQMQGDPVVKAFIVIIAAAAAAVFWTPRPHMMSFLFSTIVLYLLWLYRKQGKDRLWLIPVLMIIWANLHGGFAIGFILMVLTLMGEGLRWLMDRIMPDASRPEANQEATPTLRPVFRIAVVGLVAAAAVSLNPYGPSMLLYPFRTVGIGALRDFIQEWSSPNFHGRETWPFIWIMLGTLIAAGFSPRRLNWTDAVLLFGTAYSALLAGRNIPTFAVVAAPVLSEHTDAWLQARGYRLNWRRLPSSLLLTTLNWLILIVLLGAGLYKVLYALDPALAEETRQASLPVDAAAILERERLPTPMFNSYNWGGYLIWTARDYPVFVDGRTDLYDDQLLRQYLATIFAQQGWEDMLDEWRINTILIERNSPLAEVLRLTSGWKEVHSDSLSIIYVREEPLSD